jgi:pimeloyl-ACP methyl ester carboxylesterase
VTGVGLEESNVTNSQRFDTGEVELSYTEWPGDPPPVVALHGLSATRAGAFVEGRGSLRAFAYDHRGHGDSARTPGGYTFANYGKDAIAFLRGVVGEPALLIGHSLGAMTAIYVAAHAPDLVKAAFLGEPGLYAPEKGLRDDVIPMGAARELAGKPVPELVAAGLPPFVAAMRNKLDPEAMAMVIEGSAFAGWSTDDLLARIQCPVVLQHGDHSSTDRAGMSSAIYPGELARAVAVIRSPCEVIHLAGTGHVAWLSQPEAWNLALRDFIQRFSSPQT